MPEVQEMQDMELVREFTRDHSEAAFAELVRRHIPLVHSVARRCTGNDGDAQDVTQAVFIILARKTATLREKTLLAGWLYETTRFTAAKWLRTGARRRAREQEAYMQSTLDESGTSAAWPELAPHLETAMGKLKQRDRALLVLRFYENKSGAEAATLLGISENTAHKRVARALEKLRAIFARHGVTSTANIAEIISVNSIQAAPAALIKTTTAVALVNGATASTSTATLIQGALKLMAWTKVKTTIIAGTCLLLAAGTATSLVVCNRATRIIGIPPDWSVLNGNRDQWSWANGAINGQSTTGESILASGKKYGNVTLSGIIASTNRGADLAIRMQDADNGYLVVFTPDGTPWAAENGSIIKLVRKIAGNEQNLAQFKRRGIPESARITVIARGAQFEVRMDDTTILQARDTKFASGYIGVRVYGDQTKPSDSTFSNLTVR